MVLVDNRGPRGDLGSAFLERSIKNEPLGDIELFPKNAGSIVNFYGGE